LNDKVTLLFELRQARRIPSHFLIQNNCLYLVCYGWSVQTSPKRWFGKHEYDGKLWCHKQCTPNKNNTIRRWMNPPPMKIFCICHCCQHSHGNNLCLYKLMHLKARDFCKLYYNQSHLFVCKATAVICFVPFPQTIQLCSNISFREQTILKLD